MIKKKKVYLAHYWRDKPSNIELCKLKVMMLLDWERVDDESGGGGEGGEGGEDFNVEWVDPDNIRRIKEESEVERLLDSWKIKKMKGLVKGKIGDDILMMALRKDLERWYYPIIRECDILVACKPFWMGTNYTMGVKMEIEYARSIGKEVIEL